MTATTIARPPSLPLLDLSFLEKARIRQPSALALASMLPTPQPHHNHVRASHGRPPRPPRYPPQPTQQQTYQNEVVQLTVVDLGVTPRKEVAAVVASDSMLSQKNETRAPRSTESADVGKAHAGGFEEHGAGSSLDAWVDDLEKGHREAHELEKENRRLTLLFRAFIGVALVTLPAFVVAFVVLR